jgi:hypothetical protein
MPSVAALLGPPLGAAGMAAALATLLRDEALAKDMHIDTGPPLQVATRLLDGVVTFFQAGVQGEAARCVLAPLFGLALVATALFGLEARARNARLRFARAPAAPASCPSGLQCTQCATRADAARTRVCALPHV